MTNYNAKRSLIFMVLGDYLQSQVSEEDVLAVLDGITHDNDVSDLILELFEFIRDLETVKRKQAEVLRQEGLEYLIESDGGETNEG